MTAQQSKASKAGQLDAQAFVLENDKETLEACLQPGQLGADESLINKLGTEGTAKLFGVRHATAAWSKACDEYNRAWVSTVAKAVKS